MIAQRFKNLLKEHQYTAIDVAIILLLGLISVTWIRENSLISALDTDFPLSASHVIENLRRYFYHWDIIPPGVSNTRNLAQIPYQAFIAFFTIIGFSLWIIERLLFYFWLTSAGLSMYYLATVLTNKENQRIIGITSALFYMFNPYTMVFSWYNITLSLFLYSTLPLLLAIYIKGLENNKRFSYIFLFSILSLITSPALTNPVYGVVLWFPIFLFSLYYSFINFKDKRKISSSLKFTLILLFTWSLLNFYWIFPLLLSLPSEFAQAGQEVIGMDNLKVLELDSSKTNLLNVFRLSGFWEFNSDYKGDLYYSYSPIYSSNIFIIISFLIPLFAFISFLLSKRRNINLLYFGALALFGLFLIKGLHPPFGEIYKWLFLKFPIAGIFRNNYEKLGIIVVLSYAFLIGAALGHLHKLLTKKKKIIGAMFVLLSLFLICGIYVWPFWTGDVISSGGKTLPSYHVGVPNYYKDADLWLRKQREEFRLFSLPLSKLGYSAYKWPQGYGGADPSLWLLSKPTIARNTGQSYHIPLQIAKSFAKNQVYDVGRILGLMNVKYLLFHDDINWKFIKDHPWWISTSREHYEHVLNNQEGVQFEKSFGKLDFYKISDNYFLPHIYSASAITPVAGNINSLVPLSQTPYLNSYPAIAFTDQQDKDGFQSIFSSREASVNNQILFTNSNFDDLVMDLAKAENFKGKLEEYRNIISRRPINYLFYIDKEKIENMLKDKEKLKNINLKSDNPFRIGKQEFYIPEDGTYSVKAIVMPKRDFLVSDFVSSSSRIKAVVDAVSDLNIRALNTTYKHNFAEDGLHIDTYFQGRGDVKEGIILTKKFSDVNIKERPYLAFSWEMEDSGVQEAEIDIKFTDSKSLFFRTKKMTLKVDNENYVINLYEKAKDIFGRETADDLFVNEVVLKFKKRDGVDVPDEKKRQIYTFIFKNIAFLKTQPILAEFEDKLSAYLPNIYYYFDKNGELKNVNFPEQVPWDVKDVYKLCMQQFIDLKETPVLSFSFYKPQIVSSVDVDNERTSFSNEWKVVLGLDFDGDEKEDSRIETFVPAIGLSDGKLLLTIRAYEDTKKRFPDKRNYNLLSIGISHPDDKKILYQTVMSKKLIRYREHIYKPSDFKAGAEILKVDNKIYNLPPPAVKRKKGDGDIWVEYSNIFLRKGNHSLTVFGNDKFKAEMVEIKPFTSQQAKVSSQEIPKVEFKKVNPTRYIVDVKGAKGPFTLVFSESFHEGWKAYVRPLAVNHEPLTVNTEPWSALWSAWEGRENRIEIKDHFVVNGYANGWIVPVKQDSGFQMPDSGIKGKNIGEDFQIVLEFKPQRLFEIGLIVSATTLLGCIGYLGYDWRRKKKRKIVEN